MSIAHTTKPLESIQMPAQSASMQPEEFQTQLIDNMASALLRWPSPPCLLRAPTGSGKTYVIGQVLERVSTDRNVVWFWFVPFVTLLAQTEDSLRAHTVGLLPYGLLSGRNQDAHAGMVLLSTAQAVARAQWRTKGYDADGDDETRTLAAFVARARGQGLQVGLVVDEAHIGLDRGTEFGKFAHWLKADYLVMATATPKDDRLNEFLGNAGYSAQVNFPVGRDVVVNARLNKKYIEAVVYSLGETMAHVADLRRTVLRQSWRRNSRIKKALASAGIKLVPLLLVQVANGDKTVEEAADDLMRICGIPPEAIGKHTSDEPDPMGMASIANDMGKEVLIFKQSAGTGFDAPRAFVLASTKPVNDADFAMQFIGRVMRVARPVRDACVRFQEIPSSLNTAYVYLGNAQAQAGFQDAVRASIEVKTQLEGQTEKLQVRQTAAGAVVFTNKPTDQEPLVYDLSSPPVRFHPGAPNEPFANGTAYSQFGKTPDLWSQPADDDLDEMVPSPVKAVTANKRKEPRSAVELIEALDERGLRAYRRKHPLPKLGTALKTEEKPQLEDMSEISRAVASRLVISDGLRTQAVKAAFNRIKDIERHTELTTGDDYTEEIQVFTDRSALAREALATLKELPQAEEEDYKIIVKVLASRFEAAIADEVENMPAESQPSATELSRLTRDAAHWVIRKNAQDLKEDMFSEIARRAKLVDAKPLPDVMVFPKGISLEHSVKNIYGVMPPTREDGERVQHETMIDDRAWLTDRVFNFAEGEFVLGHFDYTWFGNSLESSFARALDTADFVLWWHRNPAKKQYSVRVVRAENDNYFYPDFVVCVKHNPADDPMPRLLETKEDTKDAARKAKHSPASYGKVLFLTPDGTRMKWVNDDGSLGDVLDFTDMKSVLARLAATRPVADA